MSVLVGIAILLLTACGCSEAVPTKTVTLDLAELPGSRFIKGITGAENICLDNDSMKVYVSDVLGHITLLDGSSCNDLEIVKSIKMGSMVLGLAKSLYGNIYAGVCHYDVDGWKQKGGQVYQVNPDLTAYIPITENYRGINGMTIDSSNQLYFASSNFSFINPEGHVYKMDLNRSTEPSVHIDHAGMANGLYFDSGDNVIYYSDTVSGVYAFTPESPETKKVFAPQGFLNAIDDLGTDSSGGLWMTDPGTSFIQYFHPESRELIRFVINGMGQTSSCRIRTEEGKEILYVTELTMEGNGTYDGRGLVIIPVESLLDSINDTEAQS